MLIVGVAPLLCGDPSLALITLTHFNSADQLLINPFRRHHRRPSDLTRRLEDQSPKQSTDTLSASSTNSLTQ